MIGKHAHRSGKLVLLAVVLHFALASIIAVGCATNPPKKERLEAERAFIAADPAKRCASLHYDNAEKALTKARKLVNQKKYEEARRNFIVAREFSEKALHEAKKNEECMNPKTEDAAEGKKDGDATDVGASPIPPAADPDFELKRIHFPFNSETITEESKTIIQDNSAWMNHFNEVKVLIEGHCDNRGSTEYNLALGERRAISVRKYLIMLGVNPDNLEIITYGEEKPLEDEANEIAWAKNRRAEFVKFW